MDGARFACTDIKLSAVGIKAVAAGELELDRYWILGADTEVRVESSLMYRYISADIENTGMTAREVQVIFVSL